VSTEQQPPTSDTRRQDSKQRGSRSKGVGHVWWGFIIALTGFIGSSLAIRIQDGATTQEALLLWGRIAGFAALVGFVGIILMAIGLILAAVRRKR
jgi:hypothetical protein